MNREEQTTALTQDPVMINGVAFVSVLRPLNVVQLHTTNSKLRSITTTTTTTTTTTLLHPFNGLFSRTTWVRRYQKSKTSLDLMSQEMTGFADAVALQINCMNLAPHTPVYA